MQTDELIAELSQDVSALSPNAARRRIGAALACGAVVAFAGLMAVLGLRPDIAEAVSTVPFWMKWAFTLTLAGSAFAAVARLARPDGRIGPAWWGIAAPLAIVAVMALGELLQAPQSARADLVLGRTAGQCALAIVSLSLPVFLSLLWACRRLAPTRLRQAGAAAGVLAGAMGASVYAFTCPESSAAFMITWYTAGIVAAGGFGALVGPRFLRW